MNLAARVARRYLESKGKQKSFVAEYKQALVALAAGDDVRIAEFAFNTAKFILPGGERPDWMNALGATRRNALLKLYNEIRDFLTERHTILSKWNRPREEVLEWLAFKAARWEKPLRTLEIASVVTDTEHEVKHGPFTVVPVPGVTKALAKQAFDALDVAVAKVQKKCPKVLYGKLFVTTTIRKGVAAEYIRASDSLYLNVLAKKRFSDIHTIIHELGHRHDEKFLSNAGRDKYWELSTRRTNPLHVTPYGGTAPSENYADGFAHFVLGMDVPAELEAILKDELR